MEGPRDPPGHRLDHNELQTRPHRFRLPRIASVSIITTIIYFNSSLNPNTKFNSTYTSNNKRTDPKSFPTNVIQRSKGKNWKLIDFHNTSKSLNECEQVDFISTTGNSVKMCIHTIRDHVSNALRQNHHWGDCDPLPKLWSEAKTDAENEVYVEIGANIGSCIMEILLSTKAKIVAFEPHPQNYQLLSQTISLLGPGYEKRMALFPIALGSETGQAQLYSAEGNFGNSVIGKPIKDHDKQVFHPPVDIIIERIDSILSDNISIPLLKLDARGFECQILDGLSKEIAVNIQQIKIDVAQKWLRAQGCNDVLLRLRSFGFTVVDRGGVAVTGDRLGCRVCDLYAIRK